MREIKGGTKYTYEGGDLDDINPPKAKPGKNHEMFIKVKTKEEMDKLIEILQNDKHEYIFTCQFHADGSGVIHGKVRDV